MRATGAPVIAMLTVAGSQVLSPAWQREEAPDDGFHPAAFARGPTKTGELASRYVWPQVRTFQTIHAYAAHARPIWQAHIWDNWWQPPTPKPAVPAAIDARTWQDWTYTTALLSADWPGCKPVIAPLRDVGLDVERFLRGSLYQFEVPGLERAEIGTWQLARSIHETGLAPSMASSLRTDAARPDLDEHNRFRAAETLLHLRYRQGTPASGWSEAQRRERDELFRDIRAELETLSLPPAAQDWISILGW